MYVRSSDHLIALSVIYCYYWTIEEKRMQRKTSKWTIPNTDSILMLLEIKVLLIVVRQFPYL